MASGISYEQFGPVTDFVSVANFRLNGLQVDASGARFEHLGAAGLANAVYLEVKGVQDSRGVFMASKVELKSRSSRDLAHWRAVQAEAQTSSRQPCQHCGWTQVIQAAGVAQRATALEAGRAVQRRLVGWVVLEPEHAGPRVQRRGVMRAAGAEQRRLPHTQRRRYVHQARIIAY